LFGLLEHWSSISQLSIAVLYGTPAMPFWLSHVCFSALCSAFCEQVTGMLFNNPTAIAQCAGGASAFV
jgi:hypothetical protein